jgi:hypothetical protein
LLLLPARLLLSRRGNGEKDGDVAFHTQLVKMKISVKNAEQIFEKAIRVLEGKIPKSSEECGYCGWATRFSEKL